MLQDDSANDVMAVYFLFFFIQHPLADTETGWICVCVCVPPDSQVIPNL